MDLRLCPDTFRADPVERTAVASGLFGKTHFLWSAHAELKYLTLYWNAISREQARRLIAAFGPRTVHDKVINLRRDTNPDASFVIPGTVSVRASSAGGGDWNVSVETLAAPSLYGAFGGIT